MKTLTKACFSILLMVLILLTGISLSPRVARSGGPWYVAPGGDDGNTCVSPDAPCATINGAISKASSGDTIYVAIGTYTGTGDEVVLIYKDITLSGGWDSTFTAQDGFSTIDGEESRRGINVNSDVATMVESFTVQNGYANNAGGIINFGTLTLDNSIVSDNKAEGSGGGIFNDLATLILDNSTISGNVAIGTYSTGGGMFNNGTMSINNSTISYNTASSGAGIDNTGGSMTINNSSINNNISDGSGGGIFNYAIMTLNNSTVSSNIASAWGAFGGGIYNENILTLNNSTISSNRAGYLGGGVHIFHGIMITQNSILADNTTSGVASDCSGFSSSGIIINSLGYNVIGSTSGCTFTPTTGDLTDIDAMLGSLVGSPGYHPLLAGSPAIDAGNPDGCTGSTGLLTSDQRGAPRVGHCDIGAYEYTTPGSAARVSVISGTPQRTPPFSVFQKPLQVAVFDNIGTPVNNITVSFSAPESGASGTFTDSGTYATATVTGESGIATASTFTANGQTGSYTVTAAVGGVMTTTNFLLSNFGWYVSSSGNDGNDCHLATTPCATINGALGKSGINDGDTVLVAIGTYTGTGDEVALLNKRVRLLGGWNQAFTSQDGNSIIDGEGKRRGITVNSGMIASFDQITIQSGSGAGIYNEGILSLSNCTVSGSAASEGDGIYNSGTLTMDKSAVSNSQGNGINNYGLITLNNSMVNNNTESGIFNENDGVNTLNNSTINGNTGRGIYNSGTLILNNSTVSGNTAEYGNGGGIFNGGGESTINLNNTTISGNSSTYVGSSGGGIYNNYGILTLQNTLIADNMAPGSGPDCFGPIESSGYNLIGDTSGCTITPTIGDLVGVDARLFSLVGMPGYHPLLPSSPAIDAGNPDGCTDHLGNSLTTDQRGTLRPLDGDGDSNAICDIGSYEFDPDNPTGELFLPCTFNNYCPDFFDDFSDPTSGWDVVDDDFEYTEYLNGEYRVVPRDIDYFYYYPAPTCSRQDYVVEVDVRWASTPGGSYGILFGALGDYSRFYTFEIDTYWQEFSVWRVDLSGWTEIFPWTYSSAINAGTSSNHLKLTRDGTQITLKANGVVLGTRSDDSLTESTYVGVMTAPYYEQPTYDVRFDNFSVKGNK